MTPLYAVELRSRHTGQIVVLGERFASYDDALAHTTDEHVCLRCNAASVKQFYRIEDGATERRKR